MKIYKYPQEIYDFIKNNANTLKDDELAQALNDKYIDMNFTESKVRAFRKNHKITTGRSGGVPKGYCFKFPQEMKQFVIDNADGKTTEELTDLINKKFGSGTITVSQTRAYKKRNHIGSGVDCRFKKGQPGITKGKHIKLPESAKKTQFKKGNVPNNTKKVGEISKTTDRYLIVKISDKGTQRERWEFLHRHIWEKEKGEIPQGKMITFLDGNKSNCDISNLALIDNDINLELQRRHLRTTQKELTEAGIMVANLACQTRKRKRGLNNG